MGKAKDWQSELADEFKDVDVNFFNPRRDNWDSSWEQSIDNEKFTEQVMWELGNISKSDVVVFFIQGDTKSPISLMELGLVGDKRGTKVIVCCEDEFWRRGNVEVFCYKYDIPLLERFDDMIAELKKILNA